MCFSDSLSAFRLDASSATTASHHSPPEVELHNETRVICLDDLTYMMVWYRGKLPVDVTQPKIM